MWNIDLKIKLLPLVRPEKIIFSVILYLKSNFIIKKFQLEANFQE